MTLTTLVTDLSFGEGPRWRNGHLYYSDFYQHTVSRVDVDGNVSVVARVANQPSGLGWMPDGDLLIVSMLDQKLLRQHSDGRLTEHADLGNVATGHCNDMVVDGKGRAYVGNFGYDNRVKGAKPVPADLAFVDVDGTVTCAATGFMFPNGSVITPDEKTLIVAETMGRRLSAFTIDSNGSLSNRRIWADLGPHYPDGICLDEKGAVWIADPVRRALVRVEEGGNITDRIEAGYPVYACMLGGVDGKRLFACTGLASGDEAAATRNGKIEYVDVEHALAGYP
ncbi:MAG: SMP-30/gluconolactonase/LRE family protein [Proteobacteria bacterium]|nr:SMP-30/gluconolactonase/LRE family protein [Pseudomonadota bacterium]